MRCDVCKAPLNERNIGYVRVPANKGQRVFECKRCHAHKKRVKERKLNKSWLCL